LAADAAVAGAEKLIAARMDAAKAAKLISDSIAGLGEKLN
jgi:F0F1-type ATP synthase membrane subunit b/b'